MISRLVTALFWALVFFALGAWSGGSLRPIGAALSEGTVALVQRATDAWSGTPAPTATGSEPAPGSAPVDDALAQSTGPADLTQARAAYARGDIAAAIAAYQDAAARHPDDAAPLGELGNVYFTAGQTENAARAWTAAGLVLVAQGDSARARALVPAIRPYDAALAARLDASLIRADLAGTVQP